MPDEPSPTPDVLTVKCPDCGTLMTAPREFAGRELNCPSCLATVMVSIDLPVTVEPAGSANEDMPLELDDIDDEDEPDESEDEDDLDVTDEDEEEQATIPLSRREEDRAAELAPIGVIYGQSKSYEAPAPKVEVFEALAHIKRQKPIKRPKYVYFSRVFEFPWISLSGLLPWIWTSLGFAACSLLVALCLWLIKTAGPMAWLFVSTFGIAILAFGLWAMSYAAACATCIVQETAAGGDVIEGWPDGGVREWVFEFLPLIYIFTVSGMVALFVAMPLELVFGTLTPQLLVVQFFTFPLTWLCALDAQSFWVPFSGGVIKSMGQVPRAWFGFYAVSTAFLVLVFGTLGVLAYYASWVAALVAGPILASVVFIYARLLGRLMWSVSEVLTQHDDEPVVATKKGAKKKKSAPRKPKVE